METTELLDISAARGRPGQDTCIRLEDIADIVLKANVKRLGAASEDLVGHTHVQGSWCGGREFSEGSSRSGVSACGLKRLAISANPP